ncbi:MAG TPA: type III pantothenate kinase [Nitrospiria bacterium]|nr:type III pantothenate kinase [Nitrospiria bacterium]
MLLAIDIGNTNIVLGVFLGSRLKGSWRIATRLGKTSDEYGILLLDLFRANGLRADQIDGVILSSVVPPLTPIFTEMSLRYVHSAPLIVDGTMNTGLINRYESPRDVGADRIVNAVAAYRRYGGPVIIVDFGTATTFCAVSKKGEYLGGAITPGITISAEALFRGASKLPKVELAKPKSVIGQDTVSSIQSGLLYGYAGLVDAMVKRMKKELAPTAKVIATGGQARLILSETKTINEVRPFLTLEGLQLLYERNKKRARRDSIDNTSKT